MSRLLVGVASLWVATWPTLATAAPSSPRPTMWPTSSPTRPLLRRKKTTKKATSLPSSALSTYRRALGVLGASYCYQTYLALEGAARALALKGYRGAEVRQRMAATQRTLAASSSSLRQLRASLGLRDRRALTDIIEMFSALKAEAAALEEWARTRRKADLRIFEDRRGAAGRRLRKLLR